jgi:hypothetical protein
VEKDLEAQKNHHGGLKKKLFTVSQSSQGAAGRKPDTSAKKYSPEEALSFATKQVRTGACSLCHKSFHYYRECPQFWTRVNEGREANAKGGGAEN